MKTKSKSRGLLNYLNLNLIPENQASSGSSRSQHPNRDSDPESLDSPYKGSVSEIKQITLNNDGADDFRTPKPIKKVAKEKSKGVVIPKKKIKRTRKKLTSSIEKHIKDNFQNLDVNPDHLQMALALSKSTFSEEYPEECKKSEEQDFPVFLSPEKIPKVPTILEKYGFRPSNKPKLHPELSTTPSELQESKKRKYSKFRFITPTLHTRTDEERESLITAKISLIIAHKRQLPLDYSSTCQVILNSETLQKYHCHENHIMNINMIAIEELKGFCYYCASVKVPPSKSSYGCLLKNWEEIPGREKSPIRGTSVIESKDLIKNGSPKPNSQDLSDDNYAGERHHSCPSPDLFDSDNESFSLKSSESTERLSSASWTVSPSKGSGLHSDNAQAEGIFSKKLSMICSSNNGIEYFESFNTDSENISKEVFSLKRGKSDSQEIPDDEFVDLTQSSSSNDSCCLENIRSKNSTKGCEDDSTQHAHENSSRILPPTLTTANEKSQDEVLEMNEFLNLSQKSLQSEGFKNSSLINTQKNPEDGRLEVDEFLNLTQKSLRCETSTNSALMNEPEDERLEMENSPNLTQKSPQCIGTEFIFENDQSDSTIEDNLVIQNRSAIQTNEICADTSVAPIITVELNDQTEYTDEKKSLDADDTILDEYFAKSLEENDKISDTSRNRLSFTSDRRSSEYNSSKSLNVTDYVTQMLNSQPDPEISENNSDKSSQMSCSQETIVISDEELNYSSTHSRKQKNDDFYNLSDFDEKGLDKNEDIMNAQELENLHSDLRNKYGSQSSQQSLDEVELSQRLQTEEHDKNRDIDDTPQKNWQATEPVLHRAGLNNTQISGSKDVVTPDSNLLIKTTNVTPMTNYDQMDTPSIRKELDKFGFKPLKRPRAIKLLKYIYETTHPLVTSRNLSSPEPEENERAFKRRKSFHLDEDMLSTDSLIFERKISSKVSSCRIPLQIAWDNFVSDNPQLQENILLYEPIQLEVVHSMLKEQSGCTFHIEDIINFLDKKCITFRTSQSQSARTKKII